MRSRAALGLLILSAGSACATGARSAEPTTPGRWQGTFRQQSSTPLAVMGAAQQARATPFGSITLSPSPTDSSRYRVELLVSAPVESNTQLAWAMFTGPCGTPSPSVVGLTEYPAIEMGNAGGAVRTVMALPLDPRGSYHVNVYYGSRPTDVNNVMMCANVSPASR